jgi:hypothetical protein
MNERTEELARQAFEFGLDTDPILYYEVGKFAESIVKECASLFDPDLTVLHEERILRESILNHFGIKE